MNLDALTIFITLAEQLHFRKTSDYHHLSVSTLTRMIQRLETDLNTTLFDRNNRRVALTKHGEMLYDFAKTTVTSYDHLRQDFNPQSPDQLHGDIKIYSTVTAAYYILPPIIKAFRHQYPKIITYLETGEVKQGYDRLLANEVDFSIGIINRKKLHHCLCKKILETPLVFIVPINHTSHKISDIPMIFPDHGDLSTQIKQYLNAHALSVDIHSYVNGHEAILAMVSSGLGSAILPKIVVDNSHLSHLVTIVPPPSPLPHLDIGLFVKKQTRLRPTKQVFWDFIDANESKSS